MRATIVRIGNSQGIRIPKVVLEQTRLHGEVDLEVKDDKIIISPIKKPRQDWDRQFKLMAERGDDKLLDSEVVSLTSFDEEEWEW
ncbi:MAG TPA: AbrB/MazE/SpoVT family DNA-binding domain-containing protein, partial [Deltaproteobacteria bacterium]|jgi:antitoxin MazE|nr:AbrB/MazE/SpoVT family DNA-binding domain-containing protein [Deltaproteobacteria bacterium]HJZ05378.1 AbrB/MazE/SpoVT family DNA-binding domain-containing protein [Patescibacteria group bacterium]